MLTKLPLENAAALIVGAGQGIGRSCSLALATEGADVALAARRREPLTAMFERMAEAQNRTPEQISDRFARQAALRRHVDPDDIAQAVLFLASPRSRNITGQEIQVTAGQHIA